jgi:hypothetical protein
LVGVYAAAVPEVGVAGLQLLQAIGNENLVGGLKLIGLLGLQNPTQPGGWVVYAQWVAQILASQINRNEHVCFFQCRESLSTQWRGEIAFHTGVSHLGQGGKQWLKLPIQSFMPRATGRMIAWGWLSSR